MESFSGNPVNTHINKVNTDNRINQAQHRNEARHNAVAVDDMTKVDNTKQYQEEEEDRKKLKEIQLEILNITRQRLGHLARLLLHSQIDILRSDSSSTFERYI